MFMKKSNKKRGFTITELVVVVSVIAILTAVLIPVFSGIIGKAKKSVDEKAAYEMNVILSGNEDLNVDEALKLLDENGISLDSLTPTSKGHKYFWDDEANTIVLVNDEFEVVYPKNYKNYNPEWIDLYEARMSDVDVDNAEELTLALMKGAKKVTLNQDVAVIGTIALAEGSNAVINLNGKKLDASENSSRPFVITGSNTTLTIEGTNATVNVGRHGLVDVKEGANATVTLNGGAYYANEKSENGAFLKVRPGATANITLNNVTYTDTTGENFILNSNKAEANVTVNGGTYKSAKGFQVKNATFTNVTIATDALAVEVSQGEATFTGCVISTDDMVISQGVKAAAIAAGYGAMVTVEGCTISGVYGLAILPGANEFDGAFVVTNTTNTATTKYYLYDGSAAGYVQVDGVVVAGTK